MIRNHKAKVMPISVKRLHLPGCGCYGQADKEVVHYHNPIILWLLCQGLSCFDCCVMVLCMLDLVEVSSMVTAWVEYNWCAKFLTLSISLTFSPFQMHFSQLLTNRDGFERFWCVEMLFGSQHLRFPAQAWGEYNSSQQNGISKPIMLTFFRSKSIPPPERPIAMIWGAFYRCSCPQLVDRRVQPHERVVSLVCGMSWWWWVMKRGCVDGRSAFGWCAGAIEGEW